jgi:hypothetical protein
MFFMGGLRTTGFGMAILVAGFANSVAGAGNTVQPSLGQIDQAMKASSNGYDLLKELTTMIGPRLTGTGKGHQAEEWAFSQFRKAGYANVRYQPFTLTTWVRGPLSLTVGDAAVPAIAMGPTPAHTDLATEIVDMRDGVDADYAVAPDKARGKIVLVYLTVSPDSPDSTAFLMRWEKIRLAIRYGAKALVFINRGTGDILSTATGWIEGPIPIPVIVVGHDSGLALRAKLKQQPLQAHLKMTNQIGPGTARNIIATLPGSDPKAKKIVFGAHLDSWDPATGALDNGAGATALLDIARLFKQGNYGPKRTIEFVLFMGEEQGEKGSAAYVANDLRSGRTPTGYFFNTDMSYDPIGLDDWGFSVDDPFFTDLTNSLRAAVPSFTGVRAHVPMPGGDPQSFAEKGIPTLFLLGNETPEAQRCQHSDCDRLDIIHPDKMVDTARAETMILWSLSNASKLPAQPLSGAALEDYLTHNRLRL